MISFQKKDKIFNVPWLKSLNLLGHAQIEEIDLGSQCGGHGICGKDRVHVSPQSHLSPLSEAEQKHLSASEISAGLRLACQCFPDQDDIQVEIISE